MSLDAQPLYFQEHTGRVNQGQRDSIARFLKNNGVRSSLTEYRHQLERTRRHDFSDVEAVDILVDLDSQVRDMGLRKFIFLGATSKGFNPPFNYFWDNWTTTVNTLMGRSHLEQNGLAKPGDIFVSQFNILKHIGSEPLNQKAYRVFDGFRTYGAKDKEDPERSFGVPGDILLEAPTVLGTVIKGAFDYKATFPEDDKTARAESVRRTFENGGSRKVLRDALSQVTGIVPTLIDTPRKSGQVDIPLRLVIGNLPYGEQTEEQRLNAVAYTGEPINIGLANVNRVALMVMKIAVGDLKFRANPENYFRPYEAKAPYQGYQEKH